jgi:hypothetical protein
MCKGQLDHGEDWVEAAEVGREDEMHLVDDKWSQTSV